MATAMAGPSLSAQRIDNSPILQEKCGSME